MIGQYTDGRGYTRNFAYRHIRPVTITEDKTIEISPAIDAVVDGRLIVQANPVQIVRKVDSLLKQVAKEIIAGMSQGRL